VPVHAATTTLIDHKDGLRRRCELAFLDRGIAAHTPGQRWGPHIIDELIRLHGTSYGRLSLPLGHPSALLSSRCKAHVMSLAWMCGGLLRQKGQ